MDFLSLFINNSKKVHDVLQMSEVGVRSCFFVDEHAEKKGLAGKK